MNDTEEPIELRSCPFCGGKVFISNMPFGGKIINCPECDIFVARWTGDAGIIEPIWNRRAGE